MRPLACRSANLCIYSPEVLAMLSLQRTSIAHFKIGPLDIAGYGRYLQITSNNLIVLRTPGHTILSYLRDIRKLKRSVKELLQGADRKVKGYECNRLGNGYVQFISANCLQSLSSTHFVYNYEKMILWELILKYLKYSRKRTNHIVILDNKNLFTRYYKD